MMHDVMKRPNPAVPVRADLSTLRRRALTPPWGDNTRSWVTARSLRVGSLQLGPTRQDLRDSNLRERT